MRCTKLRACKASIYNGAKERYCRTKSNQADIVLASCDQYLSPLRVLTGLPCLEDLDSAVDSASHPKAMKIRNVRAVLCVLAACGVAASHTSGNEISQSAVGHPFGLACGHSDPEINRVASAALQQVPQEYEGSGRRLSSFISVHNATDIVPIRIQASFSLAHSALMCRMPCVKRS